MTTLKQLAEEFVAGNKARSGSAMTNGNAYFLHGHKIAEYCADIRDYKFYWCGHYTHTTCSHLNKINEALNKPAPKFSYAKHRDNNIYEGSFGI